MKLPPMARVAPDDFRNERLYAEEVDLVLKKHQVGLSLGCGLGCMLQLLVMTISGLSTPF